MTAFHAAFALSARYIFPVDSDPIPDGVITVERGRITAVGENRSDRQPIDCGNTAILPGLVNTHVHLEFSSLDRPLLAPGVPFTEWIRQVVDLRRRRPDTFADPTGRAEVVFRGLTESRQAGTTLLGEIASIDRFTDELVHTPLDGTIFLELIGLDGGQVEQLAERARQFVEYSRRSDTSWYPGISPHAPYTVHPQLVLQLACDCGAAGVPVAMHLAESSEELQMLRSQDGPFVHLLRDLDAWHPDSVARGTRPLDYLERLSKAGRVLVIHGNYLEPDEMDFLAAHRDTMSLVYCPRTHAFFGHANYPLAGLIDRGVNVALGTDSRASNPDLNLLSEMQYVARHHPGVASDMVLQMGTIAGARALGQDRQTGSLVEGKRADIAVVSLPDADAPNPYELLWDSDRHVVATMCAGQWVGGVVPSD